MSGGQENEKIIIAFFSSFSFRLLQVLSAHFRLRFFCSNMKSETSTKMLEEAKRRKRKSSKVACNGQQKLRRLAFCYVEGDGKSNGVGENI